jgi:hypothetical protein
MSPDPESRSLPLEALMAIETGHHLAASAGEHDLSLWIIITIEPH